MGQRNNPKTYRLNVTSVISVASLITHGLITQIRLRKFSRTCAAFTLINQFNLRFQSVLYNSLVLPLLLQQNCYVALLCHFPSLAVTQRLRRTTCLSGRLSSCHVKQHAVPNDTSSEWKVRLTLYQILCQQMSHTTPFSLRNIKFRMYQQMFVRVRKFEYILRLKIAGFGTLTYETGKWLIDVSQSMSFPFLSCIKNVLTFLKHLFQTQLLLY